MVIFRALIREYIDQKQFERAREEIDLMQHKYYIEDAEIQRLSAIVNYQIWLMNQEDRGAISNARTALTTAYRSSPEHTSIVAIYLKVYDHHIQCISKVQLVSLSPLVFEHPGSKASAGRS